MNVYARCTKNGKCSRAGSLFSSPLEHTSTALHWPIASAGFEKTTCSAWVFDPAEIVVLCMHDHSHRPSRAQYRVHHIYIGKTLLN